MNWTRATGRFSAIKRIYSLTLLIFVLCVSGCRGVKPAVEPQLTEGDLRTELQEVRKALVSGAICRVAKNISPDWELSFTVESVSGVYTIDNVPTVVRTLGKAQQAYRSAKPHSNIVTSTVFRYSDELPDSIEGETREQIRSMLPSDFYLLVDAESVIPAPWPSDIRMIINGEPNEGRTLLWWMTLDGDEWVLFYSYGLDLYRQNTNRDPAAIYERRVVDGNTMVIPVMWFDFTDQGVATYSTTLGCEVWRDNAFARHAKHPVTPDDILRAHRP